VCTLTPVLLNISFNRFVYEIKKERNKKEGRKNDRERTRKKG
jgi:hypothetical protein